MADQKFIIEVTKLESGLWICFTDKLLGLNTIGRSLDEALGKIGPCGRELYGMMNETLSEGAAKQKAAFAPFFG